MYQLNPGDIVHLRRDQVVDTITDLRFKVRWVDTNREPGDQPMIHGNWLWDDGEGAIWPDLIDWEATLFNGHAPLPLEVRAQI